MAERPTLWQQPGVRRWLYIVYGVPLAFYGNLLGTMIYVLGRVPAGTSIRPMGLALYSVLVAIGGTVLGGGFGLITLIKWWKVPLLRHSGAAAILLSLPMLWVDVHFFRWFCEVRGLVLSN